MLRQKNQLPKRKELRDKLVNLLGND
jgi:hypothetical protein